MVCTTSAPSCSASWCAASFAETSVRLRQRDLHQLVRAERVVERLAQRVGEPVMPDVHERVR